MTDLNTVTLTGRLVQDPDFYPNGKGAKFVRFTIAANRCFKDRDGKGQTETAYVPCKAFGAWASSLSGRHKGELLIVSGRLKTESWSEVGVGLHYQLTLVCQVVYAVALTQIPNSVQNANADDEGDAGDKPIPF